jgi:glycerol-3-phosphate acyltransferase PlsX
LPQPIVISIDAMGGDHGPSVVLPSLIRANQRMAGRSVRYLLHGDRAQLEPGIKALGEIAALCDIRHTDLVIAMDEKPAIALRRGKGSSMWNAIEAVKAGDAHACVSAGNTGGLMAISKLQLRMSAPGLDRPAIVASWPTARGITAVLDVGANVSSDAAQLVEFAIMGEAFHQAVHGSTKPTIGLLNVGSEDAKGHEEVREAQRLLRDGGFDFDYFGFVEGDDIAKGTVDVVVTDGFTGNIALKTAEGTARFISTLMKEALTANPLARLGALLALSSLKKMRARIDPGAVNGGPLLGLNGIVVKSHGGADAKGFANAIKVAADLAASDYAQRIAKNMAHLDKAIHTPAPEGAPLSARAETA